MGKASTNWSHCDAHPLRWGTSISLGGATVGSHAEC